jgi:hypothetical protein
VLLQQQAFLFVGLVPIERIKGIEAPIRFGERFERQLPACAPPDEFVMNGKLVQQISLGLEHLHVLRGPTINQVTKTSCRRNRFI